MSRTKTRSGILLKSAVAVMLALMMLVAAACSNTPSGTGTTPTPGGDEIDYSLAPVVNLKQMDSYLELNKPVDIDSFIEGSDYKIELVIHHLAREYTTAEQLSSIGYDSATKIWTPKSAGSYELDLKATHKSDDRLFDADDKSVSVTTKATLKEKLQYTENFEALLNTSWNLKNQFAFPESSLIGITAEASVYYYDSEQAKEITENTSDKFNSATGIYTIEKPGTHTVKVTLKTGLNDVAHTFTFAASNDIVKYIETFDDLMEIENNPTLYYELANDLDYNSVDSWRDGIKQFKSITALGAVTDPDCFTGTLDGKGFTIKNLSNRIENADGTETVSIASLSLFNSPNATGTVKNLNIKNFSYRLEKEDIPVGTVLYSKNGKYSKVVNDETVYFDNTVGNFGIVNCNTSFNADFIKIEKVNVDGEIYIDGANTESHTDTISIGGLASGAKSITECNVDVNITLKNFKNKVEVGGVVGALRGAASKVNYQGNIAVDFDKSNMNTILTIMKVGGFVGDGTFTDDAIGIITDGSIKITHQIEGKNSVTNYNIGGIAGNNSGQLMDSSSKMEITVDKFFGASSGGIGGLIGVGGGIITGNTFSGSIQIEDLDLKKSDSYEKAGIGGISGSAGGSLMSNLFEGSITLKGNGNKVAGGIVGVSSTMDIFSKNIMSGTINIENGTIIYGALIGISWQGGTVDKPYSITDNLYFGKFASTSVEANKSVLGGVIGRVVIDMSIYAKNTFFNIDSNEIRGNLGAADDGMQKALVFGAIDSVYFIPAALKNATGKTKFGFATVTVDKVRYVKLKSSEVSFYEPDGEVKSNISITNMQHDNTKTHTDVLMGLDGDSTLSALSEMLDSLQKEYIYNIDINYMLQEVNNNFKPEHWDASMIVTGDGIIGEVGKQYIKFEDRDYIFKAIEGNTTAAADSEVAQSGYTNNCKLKYSIEQREASKQAYKAAVSQVKDLINSLFATE